MILVFDSLDDETEPREWRFRHVFSTNEFTNGFIWNSVQPIFDQDLADKRPIAQYCLVILIEQDGDGSDSTAAHEFKIEPNKVRMINNEGRAVSR